MDNYLLVSVLYISLMYYSFDCCKIYGVGILYFSFGRNCGYKSLGDLKVTQSGKSRIFIHRSLDSKAISFQLGHNISPKLSDSNGSSSSSSNSNKSSSGIKLSIMNGCFQFALCQILHRSYLTLCMYV